MRRARRKVGFTIIELMVVVLILGLLVSIAIPSFMAYQARSRRTEAMANLTAIERSQTTFYAERDVYHFTDVSFPDPAVHNPSGLLGVVKMPWDAPSATAYRDLGWAPEGQIFFAYEINTPDSAPSTCSCDPCFTATAYGDVDGDGSLSAVMYVKRDSAGGTCPTLDGAFGTPTDPVTGAPLYDQVAVNGLGDQY